MDEISIRVGQQIRRYRKAARWTLQQLADAIHKSRATVCKYERGEIAADVSTLGDISGALQVPLSQLVSFLILGWQFLHGRSIVRLRLQAVRARKISMKTMGETEEVMKEVKKPSWAAWVPSETR